MPASGAIFKQANAKEGFDQQESLRQPLWHVVALAILTCSAYTFYWFYKTWRDLAAFAAESSEEKPELARFAKQSCLLRSMGLLVPVLNIYLALDLLKGLAELYPHPHSAVRKHPLACATALTAGLSILGMASRLPGAFYLLSLSVCVPLVIAQMWLNEFWRSVEPDNMLVRHAFTVKELGAIIVGSLLLGLVVAGFFFVPPDFGVAARP